MAMSRLDKIVTDSGICSRKEAKQMIRSGRISINGSVVTDSALRIESAGCRIEVDGCVLDHPEHLYVMMNKPAGLLCATRDPKKPTVVDSLPAAWKKRGIFPVGRLDKDTTGLLILTDDGVFAHKVISPSGHIRKLYEAEVEGTATDEDVLAFRAGIVLKDGTECLPAELVPLGEGRVLVEIFEGKYHQVKRMLASRGLQVTALQRSRIGGLPLDEQLAPGDYRELSPQEIDLIGPGLLAK